MMQSKAKAGCRMHRIFRCFVGLAAENLGLAMKNSKWATAYYLQRMRA